MKHSKRSFAFVSVLFALLLLLSTGTLNARDADLASFTLAAAHTTTAMHEYLSRAISRLYGLEANTIL